MERLGRRPQNAWFKASTWELTTDDTYMYMYILQIEGKPGRLRNSPTSIFQYLPRPDVSNKQKLLFNIKGEIQNWDYPIHLAGIIPTRLINFQDAYLLSFYRIVQEIQRRGDYSWKVYSLDDMCVHYKVSLTTDSNLRQRDALTANG